MFHVLALMNRLTRGTLASFRLHKFIAVETAAIILIIVGGLTFSITQNWSFIDGLYFAVTTLTTSNMADPNLIVTSPGIKLFSMIYIILGIGVLARIIQLIAFKFKSHIED